MPAARRQKRQARLLLAGEDVQLHAGLLLHALEHVRGVGGRAHRGGGERHELLALEVVREVGGLLDSVDELVHALVLDIALFVQQLNETQRLLPIAHRRRPATAVRVDRHEMDRVAADI